MAYGETLKKLSPCGSGAVLETLLSACPAPRALLDAGCGRGERLADFRAVMPETRLCGIDSDAENAAAARANCPDAEIVTGDVCALPWPDALFDAALCECTLSLLPEPGKCLRELRRALRPGGVLLLSDLCAAADGAGREKLSPCGVVRWLAGRDWHVNAAALAGFRLLAERDCREELLTMAAEMIFSGGDACVGAEVFAALRQRKAGYRMWSFERSAE